MRQVPIWANVPGSPHHQWVPATSSQPANYVNTNEEEEEDPVHPAWNPYPSPVSPQRGVYVHSGSPTPAYSPVQVPVHVPVHVPVPVQVPVVQVMPAPMQYAAWPSPQSAGYFQPMHSAHNGPPSEAPAPARRHLYELHSVLQPFNRHRKSAGSLLTISESPLRYHYKRYERKQLDELATTPPCNAMKLIHDDLPWDFKVRAKDSRGVALRDILDTVWHELNRSVSENEAKSKRGHWLVMRHREKMGIAQDTGDLYDDLCRYDWLRPRSHLKLIGLSPHEKESNTWYLVFEDQ